jgi:Ca-activated chloride channel family protein
VEKKMNALIGNSPFRLLLLLLLLLPLAVATADTGEHGPSSLSPYFLVEGDDSGGERLPLKKTSTRVKLNGYMARVVVTQLYRNQGTQPINATYIFPGSTRAAVNGMTMTIGERRIVAKIKEKQEAKKKFEKAKKEGKSASLLSQKRPNVFSMEVANVMPGDEVQVELSYSEILSAEDGVYEFVYPAVVGPRYGGDAPHTSAETAWIGNPYFAEDAADPTGFELTIDMRSPLPINSMHSPSHEIDAQWQSRTSAKISLPVGGHEGNRDFILRYRLRDERILTGLTRFETDGENYFLLVSEPPSRVLPQQVPSRDYFFVIDVSGSMHGFPLDTAKQLMENLLKNLKPGDRFNVLLFAGGSKVLSPQPLPATPANISRARAMLMNQSGGGGTELYPALQRVFDMDSDHSTSRNIVLITDGYISAEDRVFQLIDRNLHRNNLFAFGIGSSVNRFLIEGVAKAGRAEAFVVTNQHEASRQARRFNDYISAPALTNIRLEAEGVELYDLEPARIPDMLAQRPVMVMGKYRNATDSARLILTGVGGQGEQQWPFRLQDAIAGDNNLPQLWARKRLERLYVIPDEDKQVLKEKILNLGLKYSLLTRHTSFVAIDETVRNPSKKAEDVKQPLPFPQGVSNLAAGRPMPEPELLWILVLTILTGAIGSLWKRRHTVAQ